MPTGGEGKAGGGGSAINKQIRAQAQAAKGNLQGMPGPGASSNYTPAEVSEVERALLDAQTQTPGRVLTDGPKPLMGVHFSSEIGEKVDAGVAPTPVQKELYDIVSAEGTNGVTRTAPTDPLEVIVDDQEVLPEWVKEKNEGVASMTPYGTTMHELGHVWADQHGLSGGGGMPAAEALERFEISPKALLADTGSAYGASDPQEGLAELYAQKYTPGFGLTGETGEKFDKLLTTFDKQGPDAATWNRPAEDFPIWEKAVMASNHRSAAAWSAAITPASPKWPAVLAAAKKNLDANRWVATVANDLT